MGLVRIHASSSEVELFGSVSILTLDSKLSSTNGVHTAFWHVQDRQLAHSITGVSTWQIAVPVVQNTRCDDYV